MYNFGREYYEEQFCEIILNLGQWYRRCCLKDFLSGALEALLLGGAEPFMEFYIKFGPVVQKMSFKEKVYGWTDA